jgi:conjugative transfer signal peptidase TraF
MPHSARLNNRSPIQSRPALPYAWVSLAGITLIVAGAARSAPPTVFFNPSESAPRGWYLRSPELPTRVGQYALAALPNEAAQLAAERAYMPLGTPLIKRVAAIHGDYVCETPRGVQINRHVLAQTLSEDAKHRPLIAWRGCRVLVDGEFFLMSASNPASFDSRYFGPINATHIQGRAVPVWIWP